MYLNKRFDEYDLDALQAWIIIRIAQFPNISQNELAEFFFLSKGTISKNISDLDKKGFIYRERIPNNKRQNRLVLSEKAEKLIPIFYEVNQDYEEKIGVEDLSDDFIKTFIELTSKSASINEEGDNGE